LRGRGIGKALLGRLAARCVEEKLGRLEWSVLDWNAPSIAFYKGMGAELMDEWTNCRCEGDALHRLAARA
jgi:RimJ/RimL family protein N-acetyltransferase